MDPQFHQNLQFPPTKAPPALRSATIVAPPQAEDARRRAAIAEILPESHRPYTDKYFLRSREILERENLNPWIRAQVFLRKGPGEVRGMDEAIAAIEKYSDLKGSGGKVYAKREGDPYSPLESLMIIEGPIQEIIELETFYLGVISAQTTRANDGVTAVNLDQVRTTMSAIVSAVDGRPVTYFGARHWDFRSDAAIAQAAFEAGAVAASTDAGAGTFGKSGIGTIPHALENIFAFYYGAEEAVKLATAAFDRHMDPSIPRVALIDYNNREIDDSLATARALGARLAAVRVDTCGENIAQGAILSGDSVEAHRLRSSGLALPPSDHPDARFWYGTGVTVSGVYALRKALDNAGYSGVQLMLTSGFGNPEKVRAFVRAEEILGVRLFDGLGVGGIYSPCRAATMDIVGVGPDEDSLLPLSKVGRHYRPNPSLSLVLGYTSFTEKPR